MVPFRILVAQTIESAIHVSNLVAIEANKMKYRVIRIIISTLMLVVTEASYGQNRWRTLDVVPMRSGVSALRFDEEGRLLIGYRNGNIGVVTNGVFTLATVNASTRPINRFHFAGDHVFYASSDNVIALKSIDGGLRWQNVTETDSIYPPMAATHSGNIVGMRYAGGTSFPSRVSHNAGATWDSIAQSQFDSRLRRCIDIVGDEDGWFFAGFYGLEGNNLYRSTDSGISWTPTSLKSANIYNVQITDAGIVVAETRTNVNDTAERRGIHRSTDNGNTWTLVLPLGIDSVSEKPVSGVENISVSYHPQTGIVLPLWTPVLATFVMRSTDEGVSWNGIPLSGVGEDSAVFAVGAGPNGQIVIATLFDLWELNPSAEVEYDLKPVGIQVNGKVIDDHLLIRTSANRADKIFLHLVNLNGRIVRSTVMPYTGATERIADVGLEGVSAGMYFIVAESSVGVSVVGLPIVK